MESWEIILIIVGILFISMIFMGLYLHKQDLKYKEATKKCNGNMDCITKARADYGLKSQKTVDNIFLADSVVADIGTLSTTKPYITQ